MQSVGANTGGGGVRLVSKGSKIAVWTTRFKNEKIKCTASKSCKKTLLETTANSTAQADFYSPMILVIALFCFVCFLDFHFLHQASFN